MFGVVVVTTDGLEIPLRDFGEGGYWRVLWTTTTTSILKFSRFDFTYPPVWMGGGGGCRSIDCVVFVDA